MSEKVERIVIACKVVAIDERLDKATGNKNQLSFTVEAKIEVLEKEEDRLGVLKGATMIASAKILEDAQEKAIGLAKAQLGI